jgi:hypothetical protein
MSEIDRLKVDLVRVRRKSLKLYGWLKRMESAFRVNIPVVWLAAQKKHSLNE